MVRWSKDDLAFVRLKFASCSVIMRINCSTPETLSCKVQVSLNGSWLMNDKIQKTCTSIGVNISMLVYFDDTVFRVVKLRFR